jgi:hypothetical protein
MSVNLLFNDYQGIAGRASLARNDSHLKGIAGRASLARNDSHLKEIAGQAHNDKVIFPPGFVPGGFSR